MQYVVQRDIITINVPLILKIQDFFFFAGKTYNGAFRRVFQGGRDLFDPLIVFLALDQTRAIPGFCVVIPCRCHLSKIVLITLNSVFV